MISIIFFRWNSGWDNLCARSPKFLIIFISCCKECSEMKFKYLSELEGFQYQPVSSIMLSDLILSESKKDILLFYSIFSVNCSNERMYWWNNETNKLFVFTSTWRFRIVSMVFLRRKQNKMMSDDEFFIFEVTPKMVAKMNTTSLELLSKKSREKYGYANDQNNVREYNFLVVGKQSNSTKILTFSSRNLVWNVQIHYGIRSNQKVIENTLGFSVKLETFLVKL